MFGFSQRSPDDDAPEDASALSMIGEGTTARGSFDLDEDDLRIDGVLDGDVHTEGHVHVSQDGVIEGEIRAGSIRIAGRAEGVLCAHEELLVLETAAVHGILCADAVTIEDEANFEGGLCDDAERISALKAVFSATEAYTLPGLSSAPGSPPDPSSQSLETPDRPVTLDIEQSAPSQTRDAARSFQEGDALPETPPSSAPSSTEQAGAPSESSAPDDADDTEALPELEW